MLRCLLALWVFLAPAFVQAGGYASYGYSAYAPYSYEYWPGGYWQGCYYGAGYYKTYYPSYDYAVKYINVPIFSVGHGVVPPAAMIATQPLAPNLTLPPAVPPVPSTAKDAPCADTKKLLEVLLRLQQDVNDLKKPKAALPPAEPPRNAAIAPLTLTSIVLAKCAVCHDAAVAKKEGKGWVAVENGQLRAWSDHDWRLVFRKAIDRADMPPPNNLHGVKPLTDAEVNVFKDAMYKD